MKLRNKKTGDIADADDFYLYRLDGDNYWGIEIKGQRYNSLTEISKDWEDYEESKEFCFICSTGEVSRTLDENDPFTDDCKFIGNYFATREEAEKAVEKLKAWKRLKDYCNFSFNGIVRNSRGKVVGIKVKFNDKSTMMNDGKQAWTDLNLLFGVEE